MDAALHSSDNRREPFAHAGSRKKIAARLLLSLDTREKALRVNLDPTRYGALRKSAPARK